MFGEAYSLAVFLMICKIPRVVFSVLEKKNIYVIQVVWVLASFLVCELPTRESKRKSELSSMTTCYSDDPRLSEYGCFNRNSSKRFFFMQPNHQNYGNSYSNGILPVF